MMPPFLQHFVEPDPRYSPVPLWWWSGEKLEINRLRWQLDQLSAMGIHNVGVINLAPSGTLFGCDADDPPFLSEPWWEIFSLVCDHARSIGTFIWFYDQIGFSGANYQAELATQHPGSMAEQLRQSSTEGAGPLSVECPPGTNPIAAYAVPLDAPESISNVRLEGRTARFHAEKPARLRLVYKVRQGYDFFSPAACQRLLDTVHRQFERRLPEHLGSTIAGSFQDELPDLPTWGPAFAQTFAQKYGYQIERVIHRLFEAGDADSRRTRLHYHAHRADLAEKSFFKPFFQWHQDHRLQCAFDQQSPAREARVAASVGKYADYTQTHRWFAAPGSDHFGNGKLHASLAFMYGHKRVWLEGFHSTGWGGTLADTFDWLLPFLRSGVNLYNPHAVYYSTRKGWWEWTPPSTCWRQPYARHYKSFADMMARLSKLLSTGVQQTSVGVLFPTATVQSATGAFCSFPDAQAADQALHQIIGSMRWHQADLGCLDKLPLDFHILDETTVQAAAIERGALTHRKVPISTLILPRASMLHDATVDQLISFARSGGTIISVGNDQIETPTGRTVRISDLPYGTVVNSMESLAAALCDAPAPVQSSLPTHYRRDGNLHILFIPAVAGMATQVTWPDWFSPMQHTTIVPERYCLSVELHLPTPGGNLWRLDPMEGSVKAVPFEPTADGVRLHLNFSGAPLAVLVWTDTADIAEIATESNGASIHSVLTLSGDWSCQYVPTLPEQYADVYDARTPAVRWPHTTEFQWSRPEHKGQPAQIVRATFGVRAWQIDGDESSPKPLTWSPKFGIQQDRLHLSTLGPKAHVPEEFVDLGKLTAGQCVTVRTGVVSESERRAVLVVGTNACKSAVINGQRTQCSGSEYLWSSPVNLNRGENLVELMLRAQQDGTVRLFWCFTDPGSEDYFHCPERIKAPDKVAPGHRLLFRKTFELLEAIGEGDLKVSIAAVATVHLDGKMLGRQGGFDPYRLQMRGQNYQTPPLAPGAHELSIDVVEPEAVAPLVVDFRASPADGTNYSIVSDASWTVAHELGEVNSVRVHSKQDADRAAWYLHRRPHPLPETNWLESRPECSPVLPLTLLPPCPQPELQYFEWTIPPGAVSMHLPLVEADCRLWIDDIPTAIDQDGWAALPELNLPPSRKAVLHVKSHQLSGGIFAGPATYRFETGTIRLGSWPDQGLRSYSGAIQMRQTFFLSPGDERDAITLNLGRVRGTVEAKLNGRVVGVRCLTPYRFDLSGYAKVGNNELELLVTNTLANFLSTWSPTRSWSPDQLECGVFGPVFLQICRRHAQNRIV